MNKTRILSLLLCLCMLCTLILPAAAAEGDPGNGMMVNKTATANQDGSYTITLEAFATGSSVTTSQNKDVPTDIILVLDQSGSMADPMGTVNYTQYKKNDSTNAKNYVRRHNGGGANLWHKLEDGSFVSVSVTKTTTYRALGSLVNYETDFLDNLKTSCYYYYAENLYEKVGDEYKEVKLTENKSGPFYDRTYTYTYAFSDGTSVVSTGKKSTPDLGTHAPLYTPAADGNDTVYTYTYTDSTGTVRTIDTSTGANTRFTPAFYQRSTSNSGGGSRINALKNAASQFASAVAAKAAGADGDITTTADNINHRIAVVGYADDDWSYGYNTGVFIGRTLNRYPNDAAGVYGTAFQDMNTADGKNNVTASLNALKTSGATRTDLGLTMAKGILDANTVPAGETRNRVVIVFTDGSPTESSGFHTSIANSAISTANNIKAGGTTVYSIGIFSGADASSAGTNPNGNNSVTLTAACNWFMQNISSNNGTPKYPSYYLSAGDAASLNNIFQQISDQITTGGSSTTLGSETVVKDIISPYFTLPTGATADNIQINTYACTGKTGDTYTWSKASSGNGDAAATVNGDQVSVTGFNFSENWCGTETDANGNTTVRGKKLVISFNVNPKDGFLGGNGVPTNANAGIYENNNATTPVETFETPTVNVPIKDVTVNPEDKNVYLLGTVTAEQLKEGATVTVGNVPLDLSKPNYGLESWQTEHVQITVTVKDASGQAITNDLTNLTDDAKYTIEVKVEPLPNAVASDQGTPATAQTNSGDANINVFKPELTFKDSVGYYGDTAPQVTDNLTKTEWKHPTATGEIMGTGPKLDKTYDFAGGTINTKEDIPVKSEVKIGETTVNQYTTFKHLDCTPDCSWNYEGNDGNPAFLIHVKTCTLKVTKTGGANDEPYVFTVNKDGTPYTEVTVVGNTYEEIVELPVGTYTIEEDTGWSWRYPNPTYFSPVKLSKDNASGEITCTNRSNNNKWLNGFSAVKQNIFKQTATNN